MIITSKDKDTPFVTLVVATIGPKSGQIRAFEADRGMIFRGRALAPPTFLSYFIHHEYCMRLHEMECIHELFPLHEHS